MQTFQLDQQRETALRLGRVKMADFLIRFQQPHFLDVTTRTIIQIVGVRSNLLLVTFVSRPCVSRSGTSTRREPTRSHGRDGRVMMVVHCWFASISEFYLYINRLINKILRWNTVTRDRNIHVKKIT